MRNPLSLEAFADWIKRQPADGHYSYWCNHCLIGQYLKETGFQIQSIGTAMWVEPDNTQHPLPDQWNKIANDGEHTFGAALERARTALASAE